MKIKFALAHAKAATLYANELSYCQRLKVGALVVKDDSVIAFGYNGMPSGEPNVCELDDGTTNPRVRHAEVNALRKLTRSRESSVDSTMFVTHAPCSMCAIDIVDAGVTSVVFEHHYRDTSGINHLLDNEVLVYRINTETGEMWRFDPYHKREFPCEHNEMYIKH